MTTREMSTDTFSTNACYQANEKEEDLATKYHIVHLSLPSHKIVSIRSNTCSANAVDLVAIVMLHAPAARIFPALAPTTVACKLILLLQSLMIIIRHKPCMTSNKEKAKAKSNINTEHKVVSFNPITCILKYQND